MEKDYRVGQIAIKADEIFLLSALAHLRVPLQRAGCEVREGVTLYLSNSEDVEKILNMLHKYGAVEEQLRKGKNPQYANDKMVVVTYQPYYKEERMRTFLACRNYLPVLVVGGIIPMQLYSFPNIVYVDTQKIIFHSTREREKIYENFINYTHTHTPDMMEILKNFTERHLRNDEESYLETALLNVANLFHTYARDCCCEYDTRKSDFILTKCRIRDMCRTMADLEGGEAVLDLVRCALDTFITQHEEIRVGALDKIEGNLREAVARKQAILFDDDFYYIPDGILRDAIAEQKLGISLPAIKHALQSEGVLACDGTKNNFTVKKGIVTSYGETFRGRFLKIKRDKYDKDAKISLAERISLCILENAKD